MGLVLDDLDTADKKDARASIPKNMINKFILHLQHSSEKFKQGQLKRISFFKFEYITDAGVVNISFSKLFDTKNDYGVHFEFPQECPYCGAFVDNIKETASLFSLSLGIQDCGREAIDEVLQID